MNKTIKILSIVLLVVMIVATASNVFAKSIINQLETEANQDVTSDIATLTKTVGRVIAIIRNVAIIAGVVILIILGLKYMMGSVEEKAGYQKSFIPLIVGILIVMGATSIASFLFSIF